MLTKKRAAKMWKRKRPTGFARPKRTSIRARTQLAKAARDAFRQQLLDTPSLGDQLAAGAKGLDE